MDSQKLADTKKVIDDLRGKCKLSQDEETKLSELYITKGESESIANPHTNGFLKDILSFGGSDSAFHRLQIIVWTLMLTVIFLREVYNTLSMPEFSAELLGLMGISSGTYLGFKAVTQK